MITPIKKENATDQIYMQLLDMIFTGSWSAGSKIPSEAELSKQFGVSRVPVREAPERHGNHHFAARPGGICECRAFFRYS